MLAATFDVLSDPIRQRIVELLVERERTAGELAAQFAVSRPAVSRHLRVLRESGLVTWRGEAQRRIYRLDPRPLSEMMDWAERMTRAWEERLDRLERHLDEEHGTKR